MTQLFTNNAQTTLNGAINNSTTSIVVTDGSVFPSPTNGNFFKMTLAQAGGSETSWEIVYVTARSGNTLTVVRGRDGTSAASWSSGDKAEMRLTAADATNFNAGAMYAYAGKAI